MNIQELLYRFANNQASPEELREFSSYLETLDLIEYQALLTKYGDIIHAISVSEESNDALYEIISRRIKITETADASRPEIVQPFLIMGKRWVRYAAAAVILFAIATTYLLIIKKEQPAIVTSNIPVLAPDKNRATITIGNKVVYLDTTQNGQLIAEGLVKTADGKILYDNEGKEGASVRHTANNPRGSRIMDIMLTDGTHIWLNAGSSLSYSVPFVERNVQIEGEAYFEVAKDAKHPFIVTQGNTNVTVLGTHFNVKAYDNEEELKVTLLEGKVKVKTRSQEQLLSPGQQAVIEKESISLGQDLNLDDVTAWKNGFTTFHGADMNVILRELERWYDIKTEMKSEVRTSRVIDVPRSVPLKDVLKSLLDDNGIKYEYDVESKKLTILP